MTQKAVSTIKSLAPRVIIHGTAYLGLNKALAQNVFLYLFGGHKFVLNKPCQNQNEQTISL